MQCIRELSSHVIAQKCEFCNNMLRAERELTRCQFCATRRERDTMSVQKMQNVFVDDSDGLDVM